MYGLLAVFIGGGIGAGLRFLVSDLLGNFGLSYEATFFVNVLGCLFLGFVSYVAIAKDDFHPNLKSFLTTGIAGGFTTFSTFGLEVYNLIISHQMMVGITYLLMSIFVGLFATMIGMISAKRYLAFENELVLQEEVVEEFDENLEEENDLELAVRD